MDSLIQRFENEVIRGYTEILRAQYRIHPRFDGIRRQWEALLSDAKRLVNGPFLEAAANYEFGKPLENLPLAPATRQTVASVMSGRPLYFHQSQALEMLLPPNEKNVVVATGTSSGKTRCFQIPILDNLVRDPSPGLRAIIIYPLNALVNDQLQDWERLLSEHKNITFARFTGQTPRDQVDFESHLRKACRARLAGRVAPDVLNDEANRLFLEELRKVQASPNHLRHREAIRANPPHILITNFSMLEYLLVRPVDAPVFEGARLRFIVLDEAHAYRSVQATEIAFLLRRLKDRLRAERPVCIATSATLGNDKDPASKERIRRFAEGLFGEPFEADALIYGKRRTPELRQPAVTPKPEDYIAAASKLPDGAAAALAALPDSQISQTLREYFERDTNILRLRSELLLRPAALRETASKLFGDAADRADALSSALTLVATADAEQPDREALLPTRLHYFVRAQDGLHVCLRTDCPGRKNGVPVVFTSRKADHAEVQEGFCPLCAGVGKQSKLVELVTCRRCGWLYGALRDLGPARARANRENGAADPLQPGLDGVQPSHDSFDTDLGWASDSFYTYFSCADELPYPRPTADDESEVADDKLLFNPESVEWCATCGKRRQSTHDACNCGSAKHPRQIEIFHRQCPTDQGTEALESDLKHLLPQCPNCLARNTLGVEPVRRFSETDDETGIAAAIPLAHFDVSPWRKNSEWQIRKLLCFADQRQKAAAFPSLLEDETFPWDFGRAIVRIVREAARPLRFTEVAKGLAKRQTDESIPAQEKLLLPVGVQPEEDNPDWERFFTAHVFAYFGVPDPARDSAEDFGVLRVRYEISRQKLVALCQVLQPFHLSEEETLAFLQTLLSFARKRKAFRLPDGVPQSHPAFGRVTADICLAREKAGLKSVEGFVSAANNVKGNENTNYISRALRVDIAEAREIAAALWEVLTREGLLRHEDGEKFRLYPSQLLIEAAPTRYQCSTCQTITAWNCRGVCPKKDCGGELAELPAVGAQDSVVARWVSGDKTISYRSLASEEHTAQIAKETAALIEEDFRGQGVNLLSSTTTFEMGINIGDLQKVLLRNAPPNAASYVQRVGRAGRGDDKNAVCVTLCKGTKYDLDCWRKPDERLMLGTVNPPTVFLENAHLAQRHINAYLFAETLRSMRAELGEYARKQEIPIALVIAQDMRDGIPDTWWPKDTKGRFLNLVENWAQKAGGETPTQPHLDPLANAVGGWEVAYRRASEGFNARIQEFTEDLTALMQERRERFNRGLATSEVERAIVNLLKADLIAVLAKRGFLPRYAFPLDVVELVTKDDRYAESDVELTRDRGLAIAEYAPGAQVIARKTLYTSGGLAFSSRRELPEPEWFWRCPACQLIRTELTKTKLKENLGLQCPVCGEKVLEAAFRRFIQPLAFRHDPHAKVSFGRNTLVRQRQGVTHFIDTLDNVTFSEADGFRIAVKPDGRLFRYNCGPGNKGFRLCRLCGRSEPIPLVQPKAKKKAKGTGAHRWLQYLPMFAGNALCTASYHDYAVAYGHVFESFCLIVRPASNCESRESLGYALHRGLCRVLQIDLNEVGVSFRRAVGGGDEIILYDRAPGGAGLVREAHQRWSEIVNQARRIVSECNCQPGSNGDCACYDCLKDFSNQTHHGVLDRRKVENFLRPLR
ncbi:MAG: DEAD/DEAH box helicase [Verrucomicrobiae bacterium]|nr:DEAD/DEAH box helicase [Verrucomicrobiae bacterium]